MAYPLQFGDPALPLHVTAYVGRACVCTLVLSDKTGASENWPAGTVASLNVSDAVTQTVYGTFPATVTGANMVWTLQVSDVATLVDDSLAEIMIDTSGTGSLPLSWFKGTVTVQVP